MTSLSLAPEPPPLADASAPAVVVQGLQKRFGSFWALQGLDMRVERGAFYAFLGPNGAGKSTTLAVLTGLYAADGGTVQLLGLDPARDPISVKSRIGIVPEELALFERLTGEQHLVFCGRMYGLKADEAASRAEELLRLTDLFEKRQTLVAAYSKGMRRRLAIASALIHAPELLFLDEPFEGIDVLAAGVIRDLLRELSRRGVTLVLTTHVLEIAERLATHAGVIQGGKLVDQGTVSELTARHGVRSLEEVFEKLIQIPASRNAKLTFYDPR